MITPPPSRSVPTHGATTPSAFVVATVLVALLGVYGPFFVVFPLMWDGGMLSPVSSVLFTAITPAAWLFWDRSVRPKPSNRWIRVTTVVTSGLTIAYSLAMAWPMTFGNDAIMLWQPAVVVALLGDAEVARRALQVWRDR